MKLDDTTTAFQLFTDSIPFWSTSPMFWCDFGVLYLQNSQLVDAMVCLQRGLYMSCAILEGWLNLGLIEELEGRLDQAAKCYQLGNQNCPDPRFTERLNALTAGRRATASSVSIVEIDDQKYFRQPAEAIALEWVADPPFVPAESFEQGRDFEATVAPLQRPHRSLF
jgi:tetratricopeptide (TPR) repeat protein